MASDHLDKSTRTPTSCSTHRRHTSRSTGSSASLRRRAGAAWWCPRRRARRRRASRCWTPAAMRSMRRWRPRWRWPRTSRGTPGLGGIGFALVHRAGQPRAEVVDFGPRAPAATDPAPLQADRAHDHRPVRLAGGRGRHQHPRAAVGRHPVLGRRLRVHAPAMGPAAAVRGDRAGHRAGEARPAAGLVHRAEGRHLRRRRSGCIRHTAAVYLPNGLPPAPPYQGKPGFFRQGNLPDDAGAARQGRPARLLRGRDRRLGCGRRQGAGRRAVAGGSAQLPGAHLAGGGGRLARPHAATHRRSDRGADA